MNRNTWMGLVAVVATANLAGCKEREGQVNEEIVDIREARKNTGNVTKDLEQQLANAKAEVVRLEKKVALAKQGVTDEVVEERKDLQNALREEGKEVKQEINEAQRQAQTHNERTDQALKQLNETQPSDVQAEVKTETRVAPERKEIQTTEEREAIPLKKTYVKGTDTATAPTAAPAPTDPNAPAPAPAAPEAEPREPAAPEPSPAAPTAPEGTAAPKSTDDMSP